MLLGVEKLSKKEQIAGKWLAWFAWKPIKTIKNEWVWLETIERKGAWYFLEGIGEIWDWDYRRNV